MKNLFDYATKELSQDAFLSWLIANYDDPDIGKYSYDFINYFSNFNLNYGVIKTLEVSQQENNIDIIAKIWISSDKTDNDPDFILAIEDKTTSSAHTKQLSNYSDILMNYRYKKSLFKLFYKANYLTDQDRSELNDANNNHSSDRNLWSAVSIEEINKFFSGKNKTSSQIFNDYVDHVCHIFDALKGKTKDSIKDWTIYHWRGFVDTHSEIFMKNKPELEEYKWVSSYQGRYVSINYQRCFPGIKDAAVIEIFARNSNSLSAVFHHAFFVESDNKRWWAAKECSKEEKRAQQVREKLLTYMKEVVLKEEYKDKISITNGRAFKCFGKITNAESVNTIEEAIAVISDWIKLFDKIVEEFK